MQDSQRRSAFFFLFPHVLLALVLIGFAPTLYLRTLGNPPPIPFYLHVHGMILTGWYTVLVVQAWLIRRGHPALHRTLGYWMAAYGVVVIAGIYTISKTAGNEGIPLFGKIPLLGWLFKREAWEDQRKDLLIFIAPKILKDQG